MLNSQKTHANSKILVLLRLAEQIIDQTRPDQTHIPDIRHLCYIWQTTEGQAAQQFQPN